ncbi:MAG: molybdopterin-dependent oxidoreductase [Pseudomonadota bacterium]
MEIIAQSQEDKAPTVRTTCPYCGVGCGVDATVRAQTGSGSSLTPAPESNTDIRSVRTDSSASADSSALRTAQDSTNTVCAVRGTDSHPANFGRLCVKGASLHETLAKHDRLLHPQVDGERVTWDHALTTVADRFKAIADEHGPDSVAFYLSGQLLTEDYYVANKLMKGYVGTANVDTNSRLCMASAVAGYKRAFGADAVPCDYRDLESCDLLIMVGSNAAWTHPVLYQRIAAAKESRPEMRVIVIDPRRTASCELADLHLQVAPGTDAALFNGLLNFLHQSNACDPKYIDVHTEGFAEALAAAAPWTPAVVAEFCEVANRDLLTFFNWAKDTEKMVSFYSQGINQSSTGTDKCNAIINVHLATGRIGKVGMGPFSITGQPNAMGGREVGGLANQLAAHMGFETDDIDRVRRFWDAPRMAEKPGLLAVDLFEAIHDGRVKAVWIMATNPVVSLPQADRVKEALEKCEFVVVSDCIAQTDTARLADVLLPARGWSEKQGTVTNSERCISLQPALVEPAGEAQDDWWIVCEVAKRMGWSSAFDYRSAHEIFLEHARLSAFENPDTRAFNIGGLADLTEAQYLNLDPIQWPVHTAPTSDSGAETGRTCARLFSDGLFYTANRRARFLPIEAQRPSATVSARYPYLLNTGRIRDQWHTMTRTGKAERLSQHIDAPQLSICKRDAMRLGVADGDLLKISSSAGAVKALTCIDNTVRPGEVFLPMHWTGENSSGGRMGVVVTPERDPYSGQPESKQTPVRIEPVEIRSWGVVLCREAIADLPAQYWVRNIVSVDAGAAQGSQAGAANLEHAAYRYEFGLDQEIDWVQWVEDRWGQDLQVAQFIDNANGCRRLAVVADDQLLAFISWGDSRQHLPNAMSFGPLLAERPINLMGLLAAKAPSLQDRGRLVCSCFKIGERQIRAAIAEGADTVEALGDELRCGTNCGSCKSELAAILREMCQETA